MMYVMCMYVCMYICMCMYVCVCLLYVCIYAYIYKYICLYAVYPWTPPRVRNAALPYLMDQGDDLFFGS